MTNKAVLGFGAFAATSCVYLIGASRAFGYDAAVTVGRFVATPSLTDPFRLQVVYNNHVLFSFLEHVVYTVTGSRSEVVLRLLPVGAAAIVVAIVAVVAAGRWGLLAGVTGAVVVATNPLFVGVARDVRGYSVLTLCAVVATLLLARLGDGEQVPSSVGYSLVLAAGLAVHLYMGVVLIGHVVWVLTSRWPLRPWLRRWVPALVLGASAYAGVGRQMLTSQHGHSFDPHFPLSLAGDLLGGQWTTAVLLGLLVGFAASSPFRRSLPLRAVVGAALVVVAGLWLVVRPAYLYPRFFVWIVPAVALAAASATVHRRLAAVVALLAAALSVGHLWGDYATDDLSLRPAATAVKDTNRHGGRACSLGLGSEPLLGYTEAFEDVERPGDVASCDIAVQVEPATDRRLVAAAVAQLPVRRRLPASRSGTLYCRTELDCRNAGRP
ncbi:MAG: hypothetical protein JWP02_2688 [Acidimicrobiales bacterium]|nr:hypothetical protein [Acidimicrobiales bacterium]